MEFLIIICSSTLQSTVIEFLESRGVLSYTRIPEVVGSGKGGGTRLNDEVWPGVNTMFLVALAHEPAAALKEWARSYRESDVREGLKVFSLALQEVI
ncbi:MAG TPA: PG0541 family transporter-associated protein [Candidatus Ozemobacteraceae bacterium]